MNSNVVYTGEVKVTVAGKKSKSRKNSGTSCLFNTICDVLAGRYNDTSHAYKLLYNAIPQKIDILSPPDDSGFSKTISIQSLEILSRKVNETNNSVTFLATLHKHNKSSVDMSTINSIVMQLLNDNNVILASVEYSNTTDVFKNIAELEDNQQCEIEWTLTFGNGQINTAGGNS